jgi:hypothetical protein
MIRKLCYLLSPAICFISCKSKADIIPSLAFGQPETEWKTQTASLINDSVMRPRLDYSDTSYLFTWNIGDTAITVKAKINDDQLREGSLRKLSFSFRTDYAEVKTESSGLGYYVNGGDGTLRDGFHCKQHTFNKIKDHLEKEYGKPDSVSHTDDGEHLWYRESAFDIELIKPILYSPTPSLSTSFYINAGLNVYAKGYQSQFASLLNTRRSSLRPKDVIEIEFLAPQIVNERHPDSGREYPAVKLISYKEEAISRIEDRTIESVKGTLIVTDRFGDVVLELKDIEYNPNSPIKPEQQKLLDLGKTWTVYLIKRPETQALRDAVSLKKELKTEFKPTAVYYSDGSVLK